MGMVRLSRSLGSSGGLLAVMAAALGLVVGCPGVPIGGGGIGTVGTLTGTVTNSVTEGGIEGASVTLDPGVEGVEITTGPDGTYAAQVPTGVYTVMFGQDGFATQTQTVAVLGGLTTGLNAALEPTQPVLVRASVTGNAAPGGSLTGSVEVEVLDGSATVQGYLWSQSNSVDVTITNANTATPAITLPGNGAFKDELFTILAEPPIGEDQLPPNVPLPEGEFPGGLQDRFQVIGLNHFQLEEAGLVALTVSVETSAGTFTDEVEVHVTLPWKVTTSLRNVPIGIPVLLHGKTQDAYDWALAGPAGSTVSLSDSTSQNPYFTPDVAGVYTVTVTDLTVDPAETVTLTIYAGQWQGAITGQDENGRPLAAGCTACHQEGTDIDLFTPWKETGHAEIFTDNLNTSTHYGENCFQCHTVGFDPDVDNGGIDEASDYEAFLAAGLINNPSPDNWTTVLDDFPNTARLANIQCENCHGPNSMTGLHPNGMLDPARISLSADVCGSCHGEPLRHGRFQQWQLSAHANFELAIDEAGSGDCSRCHTANGFLAWLPILLDDDPATDPLDNIEVTWTPDEAFPQTCVTCHDPHAIGTTSGGETNATVRISGDTPPLIGGFQVFGAGRGAICMTCHNSRRGLRNDGNFDDIVASGDIARAPHGSAQTDVLMGENAFLVEVGIRGAHSLVEDTCANCHMVQTPPPDLLSYNLGGTNHTFFAGADVCAKCHEELDADGLQTAFNANTTQLRALIEAAIVQLIAEQIAAGNTIDLGGDATITDAAAVAGVTFGEFRGRQSITVALVNGSEVGPVRLPDVRVLDGGDADVGELYNFADERLIKAGWNYNLAINDGSRGVHNPTFVFNFLDASIDALNELAGG